MGISIGSMPNPYASAYLGYNSISRQQNNAAGVLSGISGSNPAGKPEGNKAAGFNDPEIRQKKRTGEIECETCNNRKYQDGSDDPGVSFKAPTHISPESSGAAVMSHEQEHVTREQAKAQREGRKVVAQNVQIHSSTCPECGRAYVSGGKTTTVTKADNDKKDFFMDNMEKTMNKFFGKSLDLRV